MHPHLSLSSFFCLIVSYLDIGKPLQDGTWYTASSAAVIKRRVREGREREREHARAGLENTEDHYGKTTRVREQRHFPRTFLCMEN